MKANSSNFSVPESDNKNKQKAPDFDILKFLSCLPNLYFSETGKKNICKRFGIVESELDPLIYSIQNGGL